MKERILEIIIVIIYSSVSCILQKQVFHEMTCLYFQQKNSESGRKNGNAICHSRIMI